MPAGSIERTNARKEEIIKCMRKTLSDHEFQGYYFEGNRERNEFFQNIYL